MNIKFHYHFTARILLVKTKGGSTRFVTKNLSVVDRQWN